MKGSLSNIVLYLRQYDMATRTLQRSVEVELEGRNEAATATPNGALVSPPTDPTNIIQASTIADSTVPDGGYGWVVIFACSVITFWFVGTSYSWGVIQAALVQDSLSSPSTLSFVGSLTATCIAVLALVNARVIRWLGARNTGLLGVALLGSGEILGGFSTQNIGGLFATVGVVMGVGTRCVSAPTSEASMTAQD